MLMAQLTLVRTLSSTVVAVMHLVYVLSLGRFGGWSGVGTRLYGDLSSRRQFERRNECRSELGKYARVILSGDRAIVD
jgi:hypothetical protein